MAKFVPRLVWMLLLVVAAPIELALGSRLFIAGHDAMAQTAELSRQGAGPKVRQVAAAEEETKPNPADNVHDSIASGVTAIGEWLDGFFRTEHDHAEYNGTRVTVTVGGSKEEGSNANFSLKVLARIALPGLDNRLSLLVSGDGDDDSGVQNSANDDAREKYHSTDDQNAAIGMQYFFSQSESRSLSAIVGLRIRNAEPVGGIGGRYRQTLGFDPWRLRFTQSLIWYTDNGFGVPTRFDLDRPITETFLSRTILKGEWYESETGYFYEANQWVIQKLDESQGIIYQWNNHFETAHNNRLNEINLRVQYRRTLWRDWLVLDIGPQLSFPHERDYDLTPGIYGNLEIRFGG